MATMMMTMLVTMMMTMMNDDDIIIIIKVFSIVNNYFKLYITTTVMCKVVKSLFFKLSRSSRRDRANFNNFYRAGKFFFLLYL